MSKRARITLDLDPDTASEETPAVAADDTESQPQATVRRTRQPGPTPRPATDAGATPHPHQTARPEATPDAAAPSRASETPLSTAAFSLWPVVKFAVVGLAIISAVLWLKRKP